MAVKDKSEEDFSLEVVLYLSACEIWNINR